MTELIAVLIVLYTAGVALTLFMSYGVLAELPYEHRGHEYRARLLLIWIALVWPVSWVKAFLFARRGDQ